MNIILFDDQKRENLLPFTYTRPACEVRVGIFTIREKWQNWLGETASFLTEDYLSGKFPMKPEDDNLLINGRLLPDLGLLNEVRSLSAGEQLRNDELLIAVRCSKEELDDFEGLPLVGKQNQNSGQSPVEILHPFHIFQYNGDEIRKDYEWICKTRRSNSIDDPHTIVYNSENIFVEDGVSVKAAVLNAENGPIYLGKNSTVAEGALIKGPFALGEGATVNMGAKIKGDSTVGPYCKVGGEISNSVLFSYSNKGHDGFLGNSVIGEWCNLGADTNNSNLKNNYSNVKIWSYGEGRFVDTGLTFCGLMMGDHSKCGINTMFNTGTIAGVSANIFGSGFPRTLIPSFAWGGAAGFSTFTLPKVFDTAEKMMQRRGIDLTEEDKNIFTHIFEKTSDNRTWEKQ